MTWKVSDLFQAGQAQNDFDVAISDELWSAQWEDTFAAQIVRLKFNLVRAEVVVVVRQLRKGIIQDMIFNLLTRNPPLGKLHIKPVSSKKDGAEYSFINGYMVDHDSVLDYTEADAITHKVTLQFDHVNFKSPTGEMSMTYYAPAKTEVEVEFDPLVPDLEVPGES